MAKQEREHSTKVDASGTSKGDTNHARNGSKVDRPLSKEFEPNVQRMRISELRVNPEYKKLVPRPSVEEKQVIKDSISTEGQKEPIDITENKVIMDGHTRYEILVELGIEYALVRTRHFASPEEERKFVNDRARERRNLTPIQKVIFALPELETEEKESEARQKRGTLGSKDPKVGKSVDIVAKRYGLSSTILKRGKFVVKHASKEQMAALERGEATISGIYSDLNLTKEDDEESEAGAREEDNEHKGKERGRNNSGDAQPGSSEHANALDAKEKMKSSERKRHCEACHQEIPQGKGKQVDLCEVCFEKLPLLYDKTAR